MKKKLLKALGLSLVAFAMTACGGAKSKDKGEDNTPAQTITYTVAFEVDGARVATSRVKAGEKVTDEIATPAKAGYTFVGWYEGETLVDLATYVVTHNVTLVAHFEEISIPEYNINDTKDGSKTYYLVLGWWECTDMQDDGVTPKLTSHLTPETVRLFYHNLRAYLTTIGATQENLDAISFRNYSSGPVADMGTAVNADADVDILIGVGNNINSGAGVALHNSSNDYKFQTAMGDPLTDRYVACPASASDFGVATFEWLRDTQAGKDAFKKLLSQAEIDASLVPEVIDLTVTVHGDGEPVSTHLTDKDTPVTMPTITVPDTHNFKGFALSEGGAVALDVAKDAVLKYKDLKDLVAENQNTLDLYPVLETKPVVLDDLVVYVQLNSSLSEAEAKLLEARFNATLTTEKVKFNLKSENQSTFISTIKNAGDADVIIGANNTAGTNLPDDSYSAHEQGPGHVAGAKHFANSSRYVMIKDSVPSAHLTLAKAFYDFATAAAPVYNVHATFWQKANKSWVSDDEKAAMITGMTENMNAYMNITGTDTLESVYNIVFGNESVTTNTSSGTDKVADLAAATLALREGKGTDLIIGCGSNIKDQTGLVGVTNKTISNDLHTFVTAGTRYVALVSPANPLAKNIYDTYFVLPTA